MGVGLKMIANVVFPFSSKPPGIPKFKVSIKVVADGTFAKPKEVAMRSSPFEPSVILLIGITKSQFPADAESPSKTHTYILFNVFPGLPFNSINSKGSSAPGGFTTISFNNN
jgi:hypothetical protein